MTKELKNILKKVYGIDVIIAAIAFIITFVYFRYFSFVIIIGILLAALNFFVNALTTDVILSKMGKKTYVFLGSAIRIIITIIIVILVCSTDKYKYIFLIIGYTLHYLAVILYGLTIKK